MKEVRDHTNRVSPKFLDYSEGFMGAISSDGCHINVKFELVSCTSHSNNETCFAIEMSDIHENSKMIIINREDFEKLKSLAGIEQFALMAKFFNITHIVI